jgi:cobalt-zinc-cadmium efflux system membrane fusion protein
MKHAAIISFTLLALWGCKHEEPVKKQTERPLQTMTVAAQTIQGGLEATGTVQPDQEGGAKILTPLAGAVAQIFVRIGDCVHKGTPLAEIRSPEISDTYSGYLSAQAQLKQAERAYTMNKKLFEIGAVTNNDLTNSEANYEQSKALVDGLRKKLDINGAASADGLHGRLVVRAPISGTVVDIQAHLGDRFDTATPLMTIANPNHSMVVANIFDTDAAKIGKGKPVAFTTDVFPGTTFKGVVSYVSDVEDADSKTIKTYIRLVEGQPMLKQNMFLKLKILDGEKRVPVIAKSAMIYKEGKFYVQLKNSTGFQLQEIKPLMDVSDKLTAVDGIHEGAVIACSAIDLEQP